MPVTILNRLQRRESEKRMTARIFFKLIGALLCLLVVAMTAVDFLSAEVAERNYVQSLTQELANYGKLLSLRAEQSGQPLTENEAREIGAALKARMTVIGHDGDVLLDSEAPANTMENHRLRPEVAQALAGEIGSSSRPSPTIGIRYLYVALPLSDGALRFAVPLSDVQERVSALRLQILAAAALSFLPAIVLAGFFARLVSAKLGKIIDYSSELARGHFGARLDKMGKDELGILSRKLNETGENLERMFNELQREHAELEKVERVRKDFVINVSHELRTPLAAIQGYTETLLDGALDDPNHNVRFLGIIKQNTERLTSLTADLLTLSRLEMKRQEFQFTLFKTKLLMEDILDTLKPLAARREIALRLLPPNEDVEIFCDREAFYQVLSNLVDNAVKYSAVGSEVTIGAVHVKQGSRLFVEISVADSGPGIPHEELSRLFERFYRVDKARSRELGGTGLGLSIVKHLVLAHGGTVRVESTVGTGSTFFFTMPAEVPAEAEAESHQTVTVSSS
ncbi:MAG: HAMP domain-containing protein [Bryobacterales bacterium]|nr:HAMP domain-containing protein [Bryobacterales bacterium]